MLSVQFIRIKTERAYLYRWVLTFFFLFIYGSSRIDCNDYEPYELFFEEVHYYEDILSVNNHMEIGFTYLNYILPTYRVLIIFCSFITCFSFAFFFL